MKGGNLPLVKYSYFLKKKHFFLIFNKKYQVLIF
jgi:hypothetical protein